MRGTDLRDFFWECLPEMKETFGNRRNFARFWNLCEDLAIEIKFRTY